jgi:Sulfotransferase domain
MLTSYLTNSAVTSVSTVESLVPDLVGPIGSGELLPLDRAEPQLVKTHFLPRAGIMQLYREVTKKVVYLIRNPRDVCLSLMRHAGVDRDDHDRARDYAKAFLENEGGPFFRNQISVGSWPENVMAWTEPETLHPCFPDAQVLTVAYESLRADPVKELHSILDFMDLRSPVEPDDVRKAVENSSIEVMREVEQKSPSPMPGMSPFGGHGKFVGQGRSDQSLAFLGDDIEAAYQRLLHGGGEFAHMARRFGYDK